MNYYRPLQQAKTDVNAPDRWDFTCQNDDRIWPVGYCRAYSEPDPNFIPVNPDYLAMVRSFAHKHHTTGHATREEACACYKDYLLDQRLDLDGKLADQLLKCKVCGEFTKKRRKARAFRYGI